MTDHQLLQQYRACRDQAAFAELVRRHIDLVYGVARRHMPAEADDITQAVFVLLARQPHRASARGTLAGWLFTTTRYLCLNARRVNFRRKRNEMEAARMNRDWSDSFDAQQREKVTLALDSAIAALPRHYRDALLLRYLQGKNLEETGSALGISPAAASKVATRALEKLRQRFSHMGITLGASGITTILIEEAAKAAPTHLAFAVAAGSLTAKSALAAYAGHTLATWKIAALVLLTFGLTVGVAWGIIARDHDKAVAAAPLAPASVLEVPDAAADEPPTPVTPTTQPAATAQMRTCFVAVNLLLTVDAADAIQKLAQPLEAKSTFFTLYRADGAKIRAALKDMRSNGQIAAICKAANHLPIGGVDSDKGESGWAIDPLFDPFQRAAGMTHFQMSGISGPFGKAISLTAASDGPHLKIDLDNVQASLTIQVPRPGVPPIRGPQKTGFLHWEGPLLPGQTILMLGDFGPWQDDHLVDLHLMECYAVPEQERQFIKELGHRDNGASLWIDGGLDAAREFADRMMVWSAKNAPAGPGATQPSDKWTQRLSDGGIVTLLSLARPNDDLHLVWDPDGYSLPFLGPTGADMNGQRLEKSAPVLRASVFVHDTVPESVDQRDAGISADQIMTRDPQRITLYCSVGPYEETIVANGAMNIPVDGVRLTVDNCDLSVNKAAPRPNLPSTPTQQMYFLYVVNHLPPELEVRLVGVTKSHELFLNNSTPRTILIPNDINTDGEGYIDGDTFQQPLMINPTEIDHLVVLSRKREKVVFENFAAAPRMELPAGVTPQEILAAEKRLDQAEAARNAFNRNLEWMERSTDIAALDALPHDPSTPAGAMRIMMDKILAGDAAGIREGLTGDAARCTAVADRLALFGRSFTFAQQKLGLQTLSLGAPGRQHFFYIHRMPAESLIAAAWSVHDDIATNHRPNEFLVRRNKRWLLDLNRLKDAPEAWANYAKSTEIMQTKWEALLKDIDAGKKSPESLLDQIYSPDSWKPW